MADPQPADTDVPLTTRLGRGGYQVVALLAMLAHLLIVGPLCLFTLVFSGPPDAEWIGYVLKATIAAVWFGFGYLGLKAWDQRAGGWSPFQSSRSALCTS